MVIVDGVIRKEGGKLKRVGLGVGGEVWDGEKGVRDWRDVSKELVRRRVEIQKKVDGIGMEDVRKEVIKGFYIDESKMIDSV
jgi:hypothetical protein